MQTTTALTAQNFAKVSALSAASVAPSFSPMMASSLTSGITKSVNWLGTMQNVAGIASTVSSVAAPFKKGYDMSKAEQYNATVASIRAREQQLAGDIEAMRIKRQANALYSTQLALYAKAGVALEGSPLEVMRDSYEQMKEDELLAKYNTAVSVSRSKSEATYREQLAKEYKKEGMLKSGLTLLTVGSDFASKYWRAW